MLLCRLIKGDGEIMEEIVSKDRHKDINKVRNHLQNIEGSRPERCISTIHHA